MKLNATLQKIFTKTACAGLLVLIFAVDVFTGPSSTGRPDLSFLFIYFMVVVVATRAIGGPFCYALALTAAVCRTVGIYADTILDISAIALIWQLFNLGAVYMSASWLLIQKDKLIHQLRVSALTDPLTHLPNRRAFEESLQKAVAHCQRFLQPLTVAYIDIDGFKSVNDNLGHHKGDDLLNSVGRVLLKGMRADDHVARLGGDEFAIIFVDSITDDIEFLLQRIKGKLDACMLKEGYQVTFSIGAIKYNGARYVKGSDIIKRADRLMYEVKNGKGNGVKLENF